VFTTLKQKLKLESVFFFLLLFVLATLSFGIAAVTNLSLMILALVGLFTIKKTEWRQTIKDPITLSFWAFFIIYLVSLSYSCNVDSGWRNLETKMSFLIAAPILRVYQARLSNEELVKLLKAFILGVLAALVFLLVYASIRSYSASSFSYLSAGGTYQRYFFLYESFSEAIMHPSYLSLYVGMAFLACLYLGMVSHWNKKQVLPIIAIFSIGLLLLQGRMTIIALFLSLGLWLLVYVFQRRSWQPIIVTGLAVLILSVIAFKVAPKSLSDRYLAFPDFSYNISGSDFNSATYRLAEWKCAWDGITNAPILGYGIGCGQTELFKRYEKFEFWEGLERQYNAHNQYLETMLSAGTLGLGALLFMLSAIFYTALKSGNYFALYALLFFSLCLVTESMLERAWAVILFNVFFPLFTNLRQK